VDDDNNDNDYNVEEPVLLLLSLLSGLSISINPDTLICCNKSNYIRKT